jgi:hypothetical protein
MKKPTKKLLLQLPEEISCMTEFITNGGRVTVRDLNDKEHCFYLPKWMIEEITSLMRSAREGGKREIQYQLQSIIGIRYPTVTCDIPCECKYDR